MLTGRFIAERLYAESDPTKKIVITPILNRDRQLNPRSASVDLRLGTHFLVARRAKLTDLDSMDADFDTKIQSFQDHYYVPIGDYFVLHPNHFVLGETLEYIGLPGDVAGYVITRSSWGRHGLVIATAIGIQPRYFGIITLELRNLADVPIRLYPGKRVLQLFLHPVGELDAYPQTDERPPAEMYAPKEDRSRYRGSTLPEMGQTMDPGERKILLRFTDFEGYPIKEY